MNSKAKAGMALVGTLGIGILLGVVVSGALAQQRRGQVERLRAPGGFVEHMERVISPTSSEQRAALQPLLEAADDRNRGIVQAAEAELSGSMQQLLDAAGALLDEEQATRLAEEVTRARFGRPPPPGARPPRGGGPGRGGPGSEGGRPSDGRPPPGAGRPSGN
ncbi:MAG: hypothetical protein AAF389_05490 [Gemmatimonadota bacterium]